MHKEGKDNETKIIEKLTTEESLKKMQQKTIMNIADKREIKWEKKFEMIDRKWEEQERKERQHNNKRIKYRGTESGKNDRKVY